MGLEEKQTLQMTLCGTDGYSWYSSASSDCGSAQNLAPVGCWHVRLREEIGLVLKRRGLEDQRLGKIILKCCVLTGRVYRDGRVIDVPGDLLADRD